MNTQSSSTGNQTKRISIPNPFDYKSRKSFLPLLRDNMDDCELILDFKGVQHLDSSALGMLLMAREKVGGSRARISLVNCNENIRKILTIAQFDILFKIS